MLKMIAVFLVCSVFHHVALVPLKDVKEIFAVPLNEKAEIAKDQETENHIIEASAGEALVTDSILEKDSENLVNDATLNEPTTDQEQLSVEEHTLHSLSIEVGGEGSGAGSLADEAKSGQIAEDTTELPEEKSEGSGIDEVQDPAELTSVAQDDLKVKNEENLSTDSPLSDMEHKESSTEIVSDDDSSVQPTDETVESS